jgi:hypothetical protein
MRMIIVILVCAIALWAIDFSFFDGIYFRAAFALLTLSPH